MHCAPIIWCMMGAHQVHWPLAECPDNRRVSDLLPQILPLPPIFSFHPYLTQIKTSSRNTTAGGGSDKGVAANLECTTEICLGSSFWQLVQVIKT
jgi:hypothetical protein